MLEVLLCGPYILVLDQTLVCKSTYWSQVIVFGEERLYVDYSTALTDHLSELCNHRPHVLDQIALPLPKLHRLILDIVNLELVDLNELCESFVEDSQRTGRHIHLTIGAHGADPIASIDLGLHKAALNKFQLLAEPSVDALHSLAFLLQARRCCKHGKLFLLNFEDKLVTDRAQFVLKVNIVGCGLLWLVGKKSELLGQQGNLLLLCQLLCHYLESFFGPA